ncbi:MAG: putative signaling protein [uncultured marine phage]|uniref:Putative signaling protein n=1 Tax=uncultured marine phage TaxID=707152 RepID=A0A8D9FS04_9VIRU|nr:MAG: putative signaling protein [uncultured marine phage]
MKKLFKLFLLNLFVLVGVTANSQCVVTATTSVPALNCGECADLNAIGTQGVLVMDNDFNTGVPGAGWAATSAADFSNPCGPGPDGTYMWMGSTSPAPRTLTTNDFDMSCGGQVCFDFRMAEQGGGSPCEGPDEPTEGIYFQYSTDGGTTWTTINYFDPAGGYDPTMTNWNNYCFTLPAGAWTTNTLFQWTQDATSSNLNDHWGIDNVQILANDCGYYYDWAHIAGDPNPASGGTVCPTTTTTYDVIYTDGISDTCYASVTVEVLMPDVDVTATPPTITTCGGCTTLDGSLSNIPPDSCCYTLDMDDSFGDGWNGANIVVNIAGGGSLGPFTAAGAGSVVTFCVADGETFTLNYTAGTWESEVTYTLLDPSSTPIFSDGTFPSTGNVFTTVVDCGTPPPVYIWNWIGPSLTAVNDSTQTACPTADSWYYVEVSSGACMVTDSVFVDVTVAPTTSTEDITICSGDDYTFPDGSTTLGIVAPMSYASTLVDVSGCDSIVTTNITLFPTLTSTENVSICSGEDYTFPDGSTQVGIVAPVTYVSTLTDVNGCDSLVTTNITLTPSINVAVNDIICPGNDYTFPDGTVIVGIVASTVQVSNLVTGSGCDSIITTTVDVYPEYNIVENVTICSGDDHTFPDGSTTVGIVAPMSYVSNLLTTNGCDSIITTNVAVDPIYNITEDVTICSGDNYTYPDGSTDIGIVAPTSHVSNLVTGSGCDSIITTNITLYPILSSTENVDICDGDNYTFPDGSTTVGIVAPMSYVSTLTDVNGCDSLVTTNISIYPTLTSTENFDICDNSNYTFPDGSTQVGITVPTTYVSTLTDVNGCDSLVTTNLSIVPDINIAENFTICSGDDYTFPDGTVIAGIVANTVHVSNFITGGGCDSIITTTIDVYPVFNLTEDFTICSGDNYTYPDGTVDVGIVAPTSHVSNLTTVDGCDSIITTNITLNPVYDITEDVFVCSGDSYTYPDGTVQASITTDVIYVSNLLTTDGCDSTITTNVTVNPVYSLVENVDICSGSDYTYPDGFTEFGIVAPTSHVSNLVTTSGCDSVITTTVGLFTSFTTTLDYTICNGGDFTFADGSTQVGIVAPTSYVSTLTSVDGCDSLVTENITLYPTFNIVESFDQCPGNDFTFPDGSVMTDINTTTVHVSNLTTVDGCDSTITTTVNIYNVPPMDVTFSPNMCPPALMTLTNNALGTDCEWTVSGAGFLQNYTGCGSISDTYYNSGMYDVSLTMLSVDGCPMDTTIVGAFEVFPVPVASFNWDPNEGTIIENTIYFDNTSIGGSNYYWDYGDGETSTYYQDTHTYEDTGSFNVELIVMNDFGCTDTTNGRVIINSEFFIFVPNAFTPDGDAYNNTFNPIVNGHDQQRYTLYIFNRWGEIIFESHNSDIGWDGHYGSRGLVKDGVFVWQIEVWTLDGKRKEFRGHVTVLK